MLPRHPPPHTPPFSQLSPGSPRSQPAPIGSFRANPYGTAAPRGADGEPGGPFGAEAGTPTPPRVTQPQPGRSRAHTWPLPERPRTVPERLPGLLPRLPTSSPPATSSASPPRPRPEVNAHFCKVSSRSRRVYIAMNSHRLPGGNKKQHRKARPASREKTEKEGEGVKRKIK